MVEYNKVNVKLSNNQLKKLENAVKNKTGITLGISSQMFDGNDLPHELLLTTRQKTKLRNAFNNNTSADIKLSKAQINKIIQSGGFLGSLLSKLAGPLMKIAVLLAKKCFRSIRNNSKDETKEQKGGFVCMLLGTLGASLLGNLLSRKGIARAIYGHFLQNTVDF